AFDRLISVLALRRRAALLRADAVRRRLRRAGRARRGALLLVGDARPGLAAAEDQHAALQLQPVRVLEDDADVVVAALFRVVDLAVPFVRLARLHRDEDRRAEQRATALRRIGILGVPAGLALPVDAAPVAVGAVLDAYACALVGGQPDARRVG